MRMKFFVLAAAVLYLSSFPSASGLKCYEGFNMSLNGIPLSYWNERECKGNSKCIEQELSLETDVSGTALTSIFRYGACMNSAYANYLDCETLFGKDSTFDPSNLLDIIPGIEASLNNGVEEFSKNSLASIKDLLSDGNGMTAFVDGVYTFYENLGFNLTKAIPLKPSIVKILVSTFTSPEYVQQSALAMAYVDFFNTLAQLDTANPQFSTAIRTVLTNVGVDRRNFENAAITALTDRGPGLLRSMLPADWQMELWYDVAFKLVGDINPRNWTESSKAMVSTIKSSYRIPRDVAVYLYPILDALPDLATGSQVNPMYVGQWSLDLLTEFSTIDSASKAFSSSLVLMLSNLFRIDLQKEVESTIYWLPGLFYKMFPGDKIVIEEVYKKMGKGLMSFNALNISSTAPDTKLSIMIKNMIFTLSGPANFQSQPLYNAFVVNFAKMFYDLMNVTSTDYTGYIDDFATVIDDEFKMWPSINVGKLIGNLIVKMGGEIPLELKPLLDNIQPAISAAMQQPVNDYKLLSALYGVTASYQASYPNSEFPELVKRYINITYQLLTVYNHFSLYEAFRVQQELNLELQYWNIDLQFAIVKAYDFDADKLYQMMIKAWPQYDLYIRILRAVDPEDVKQLMKDIITWSSTYAPRTTKSFVAATKPTFRRLSNSIKTLLGEIRQSFAPKSCRFTSCSTDLCNTEHFTKGLSGTEIPKQIGSTASSSREREATAEPLDIRNILNWNMVTGEPHAFINWTFDPSINGFGTTDDVKLDETTTSETTNAMEITTKDNGARSTELPQQIRSTASSSREREVTMEPFVFGEPHASINWTFGPSINWFGFTYDVKLDETTTYETTDAMEVTTKETGIMWASDTASSVSKMETTFTTEANIDEPTLKEDALESTAIMNQEQTTYFETTASGMEPDSRPIGLETTIREDTQTHIVPAEPLFSTGNTPEPTRETKVAVSAHEETPKAFATPPSNNGADEPSLSYVSTTPTTSSNINASISSIDLESKTESATSLTVTELEGSVQNATARGSFGSPLNTTSTGQRFSHYSLLNTFALCLTVQLLYR